MKFLTPNDRGYSLVETLVAVTILMMAIAGPLTIAFKGIQSATFAKDQTIAFLLAQEGIESVTYIRNEYIIRAINGAGGATLNDVWNWVNDSNLDPCFLNNSGTLIADGDDGCNIIFNDTDLTDGNSVVACNPPTFSNCVLDYDQGAGRAKFHQNNGSASQDSNFTRVITIEHINDRELRVVSEVSWQSNLFSSTERVTLVSHIFKLYEPTS